MDRPRRVEGPKEPTDHRSGREDHRKRNDSQLDDMGMVEEREVLDLALNPV